MKIICIGRNYFKHVKELGNVLPSEPLFFLSLRQHSPKGHPFFIPHFSNDIQYEVELVLKIKKAGKHIEEKFSHKYYSQIGLGIDFTARDVQHECKAKGLPWEKAKGFDGSAQVSSIFIDKLDLNLHDISFSLNKNGQQVQFGNSSDMIFNFDKIISFISKFYSLKVGDLIYTGTPEGVGGVKIGDVLNGFIGDQEMFKVIIK